MIYFFNVHILKIISDNDIRGKSQIAGWLADSLIGPLSSSDDLSLTIVPHDYKATTSFLMDKWLLIVKIVGWVECTET